MARSRAVIYASIWSPDDDFVRLSADAQRVYFVVLSQPKLSLAGAMDYMPNRWASMAADTTVEAIEAAISELEAARYVLVDRGTAELAVRSFTRHDLPDKPNINQLKGVWSAWSAITSPTLRHQLVHAFPAHLWDQKRCPPPVEATRLRDLPQPTRPVVATPVETTRPVENPPSVDNPTSPGASPQVSPDETTSRNDPSQQADATIPIPSTAYRQPSTVTADPSDRPVCGQPNEAPLTVDRAWTLVLDNVRTHGRTGWTAIDWPGGERGPLVTAIRDIGWSRICAATDRDLTDYRTRFRNAYTAAHHAGAPTP